MKNELIELKAESVLYGSRLDEDAFFEWLERIPCVESFKGRGIILYINVAEEKLDQDCVEELLALFDRYDVDMKQLKLLEREAWSEWLHDKDKYWHHKVFGESIIGRIWRLLFRRPTF